MTIESGPAIELRRAMEPLVTVGRKDKIGRAG